MPAISCGSIRRYISSTFRVYRRVCGATANNLSGQLIEFPSGQRAIDVAQRFEEKRALPGVQSMDAIYQ